MGSYLIGGIRQSLVVTGERVGIDGYAIIKKRNEIAVLADDNGVFFVDGFGIDERVKITESTKCSVRIKKGE